MSGEVGFLSYQNSSIKCKLWPLFGLTEFWHTKIIEAFQVGTDPLVLMK